MKNPWQVDAQSPGYAASFLIPMADAESTPPQAVFGNVSFFDKTFDDHFRVNRDCRGIHMDMLCVYIYEYIYIYIEREREREV